MMKKLNLLLAATFLISLSTFAQTTDPVVATVNGTEIKKAQIVTAKMTAEDANDALELTIKVYPDQEKVLKSTYQF